MKAKTDDDPIARQEAITAENLKMKAREKIDVEAEDEKAENAIRELSYPVKMPLGRHHWPLSS